MPNLKKSILCALKIASRKFSLEIKMFKTDERWARSGLEVGEG